MSVEAIGIVSLLLGLWCLLVGNSSTIAVIAVAAIFGSATALSIGSANVQPGHVLLGILLIGVFTRRAEFTAVMRTLHPAQPGFWLALFLVYGIASAFILPRILAGTTQIVPLGATMYDNTGSTVPLAPVSTNFTQSIYLICDVLCFLMTCAIASTARGFRAVLAGILGYCVANIAFALIDLATFATGTQGVLGFMRNTQYVLHTEEQIGGMKRIVGSFAEASSFARSTLGVLGVSGTLWLFGYRQFISGAIALTAVILLILSTSSTGLAGVPVMLVFLYGTAAGLLSSANRTLASFVTVILGPVLLAAIALVIAIHPDLSKLVSSYIDLVVLGKSNSDSGIERSSWNTVSIANFLDSWGLGVGLGTVRSSSFPIALLANVGLPGTFLYLLFAAGVYFHGRAGLPRSIVAVQMAARNGCIGLFVGDLVVGTVVDQGLIFFIMAALATTNPAQSAPNETAYDVPEPLGAYI